MTLLEATGLRKHYAERVALDGISFNIRKGQTLGLIGPNGAGKSTTAAILAGLLKADAGQIRRGGIALDPTSASYKHNLGLVPQELAIYDELTVRENLRLFGALYGMSGRAIAHRSAELLELVALSERADDFPSTFSGGMKRRLNIALSLMHNPELVILDEPTVGIDPQSRNAIFDGLEVLQQQGKTLIYTSHYMEEVARLADHLLIIDHGKVIADDSPANLQRRLTAQAGLELEFQTNPGVDLLRQLQALPGVQEVKTQAQANSLMILLQESAQALAVLNFLSAQDCTVLHFATSKTSLESIFLQLTGRSLRD